MLNYHELRNHKYSAPELPNGLILAFGAVGMIILAVGIGFMVRISCEGILAISKAIQ